MINSPPAKLLLSRPEATRYVPPARRMIYSRFEERGYLKRSTNHPRLGHDKVGWARCNVFNDGHAEE
jgi:hypothetical protein